MSPPWDPGGLDPKSLNGEGKKHRLPECRSGESVHSLPLLLGTQARESHLLTLKHCILAAGAWQLPEGWCPVLSGRHLHAGVSATLPTGWQIPGCMVCFRTSGSVVLYLMLSPFLT